MKEKLENIIKEYIKAFESKHEMYFEFAVNDEYLGTLSFGCVYYINTSDLVYDIDNNLPKHLICDWVNDNLENQDNYINLNSYSKGVRHLNINPSK